MKNLYIKTGMISAIASLLMMASCTEDSNSPGVEYMPDMYRSPAIEAYVDYENLNQISARTPVEGTVPYVKEEDEVSSLPYPYPSTMAGYEEAGEELTSPIPTTRQTIANGEAVYTTFCIHCHGESGGGDGSITEAAGGKFPVVPSYESRKGLPEGKMYHTVKFGKGLMGPHDSQLSQKEMWEVVLYVKALMYGMPEFDEEGNVVGDEMPSGNGDTEQAATEN